MSSNPDSQPAIPTFAELAADPEIAPLLDFKPVPRKIVVEGGWSPERQREFIARLAVHGSPGKSCEELGMNRTGVTKLYKSPHGASFRDAWHGAVELATRRRAAAAPAAEFVRPGTKAPSLDNRRKSPSSQPSPSRGEGEPGEVLNEFGEWEDEGAFARRVEDARDSITNKLLRARRLYLQEICGSAGKRAAFEILTELPIDWDKAERCEPQPDEPYHRVMMRKPDMLLTAENGWLGDITHGPNKLAELRKDVDEYLAEEGLPPVDWDE
jgi:hypothetical protein